MSSRGGGSGFLVFLLWLLAIGINIEILKLIVTVVSIVLIMIGALIVLTAAIYGLGQFFNDVGNNREIALKSAISLCLIGIVVLLGGPKLLTLFQTEAGMLWWRRSETHYFRLMLFMLFTTPLVLGFG